MARSRPIKASLVLATSLLTKASPALAINLLTKAAQHVAATVQPTKAVLPTTAPATAARALVVKNAAAATKAAATGPHLATSQPSGIVLPARSEERRVGQECVSKGRSRWSPEH